MATCEMMLYAIRQARTCTSMRRAERVRKHGNSGGEHADRGAENVTQDASESGQRENRGRSHTQWPPILPGPGRGRGRAGGRTQAGSGQVATTKPDSSAGAVSSTELTKPGQAAVLSSALMAVVVEESNACSNGGCSPGALNPDAAQGAASLCPDVAIAVLLNLDGALVTASLNPNPPSLYPDMALARACTGSAPPVKRTAWKPSQYRGG
jgi:hypothetical protein